MELNRESVRAPPNRTVFDSHSLSPSSSCQARYRETGRVSPLSCRLIHREAPGPPSRSLFAIVALFQAAGPSPERPPRHQSDGGPGRLVPAAQTGLSSGGSAPNLQRGDWPLLPRAIPDPRPEPPDCVVLADAAVLVHTRLAPAPTSAARKCGQQERQEHEGEVPEAPAGVTVTTSSFLAGGKTWTGIGREQS